MPDDRRFAALACPACGGLPQPASERCPGCGRHLLTASGALDLLTDPERAEADRFARDYLELRASEGWVGPQGREDPVGGDPRLWRGRTRGVEEAARVIAGTLGDSPLVLDVGSGGGWAARMLGRAQVIAVDLLDAGAMGCLAVRGDMRRLPVRDAAVNAALYVASLHHAPVDEAIGEAARVLRPDGLLVALDSPIYGSATSARAAQERSAAYYVSAGHPALAAHYHPIEAGQLRQALEKSRFEVIRLAAGSRWRRLLRGSPGSVVVARRLR
jgi:SAM-dependent methyltransferase